MHICEFFSLAGIFCILINVERYQPYTCSFILLCFFRYVLDNSSDFESKLQRLVNIVSKLVGLPTNLSKRSAKYLLRQRPNTTSFNVDFHIFEVEKVCMYAYMSLILVCDFKRRSINMLHIRLSQR